MPGGAPDTEPPECHRRPSPTADFRRPSRSTGSRAILIVLSRPRVWRSGGTEGGVQRTDSEKVCAVHLHGTAIYLISKYTSVLVAAFLPLCLCGYLILSYLILSWSWWSCHHGCCGCSRESPEGCAGTHHRACVKRLTAVIHFGSSASVIRRAGC